ncbi:HoxN/HupN/NixA family nickel/cobalt transporter [Lacticaseibacillus paracasei]|uniref:HoxN/HupN/NixA family nickel/cobalt transporter n=1 Tax=Lacticaseibacillus paracasei TaxID=1597 RepID=UPI003857B4B0
MNALKKKKLNGFMPYYLYNFVIHLMGVVLLIIASASNYHFWGLGLLAYSLGLRHAFDADHIAAIDNTVRKLVQQQKSSYGVGFYFSLGHSTVVLIMVTLVIASVKWAKIKMPFLEIIGGNFGSFISGSFLMIIATCNLITLVTLYRSLKDPQDSDHKTEIANDYLISGGFLARILKPLFRCINSSWKMYPIGFLFGLGFDTATEITLLALSAGAAQSSTPLLGIISLPILFTAGMNLMDTIDSVMMSKAYMWALNTPIKKTYYNLTVTTISVIAAFSIGIIELNQAITGIFHIRGGISSWISNADISDFGYDLVAIFIFVWIIAYVTRLVFTKKSESMTL